MRGMNRAWKWVLLLAVVASPWLVGLSFPFLYDDIGMLSENTFLENPANLGRVLTGQTLADPQVVNGRRPAVLATYFGDRAAYGLQPAGWRATSLMLHMGCMASLMCLLWRLTGRGYFSAAVGVLFGLHPVLAEAVHAPGFRADVLCLFFVLAAMHGFLSARQRPVAGLGGGGFFMVLALLSKETALAAPILLGVLMFLFPAAFPVERRAKAAGLAVCAGLATAFFALWTLLPTDLQAAGSAWNGESLRFPESIYSIPSLWTRTLRLLLVPWPLNVTPGFEPVASTVSLRFAVGLFWLAACGLGAWKARRTAPEVSLGLLWMLVFFVPVSNLWPLLHPVADRYFYSITPGFAVLAAWVLSHQSRLGRTLGLAALAAIYAFLLMLRLGQWQTPSTLWTTAYFQNPNSATAATWLGLLREEAGDAAGAQEFYRTATEVNPQADPAWINWGILEGQAGHWAESERLLRHAVELRPEGAKGWQNLAVCLERQGRSNEAAEAAARAAALQPD
jgi:protein O-mannosyl-transferase